MKWRLTFADLFDKNTSPRFRGKFYRGVVKPMMLYGVEHWLVKNLHIQKMRIAKAF